MLIAGTLIYTKRAAEAAGEMVVQAKATTKAAQDSVEEARKATKFSQVTADVAREALATTDRAWIKIEAELADDLVFDPDKIWTKVRVRYFNVGKSPATHVMIFLSIHPDIVDASLKAKDFIDGRPIFEGAMRWSGMGIALFPDETGTKDEELELPTVDFTTAIAKGNEWSSQCEEPFATTVSCPGVLAGIRYILPGERKYRYTYVPFAIERAKPGPDGVLGWDGAERVIPWSGLAMRRGGQTGLVS